MSIKSQIKSLKTVKALKWIVFSTCSILFKVRYNLSLKKCALPSKEEAMDKLIRGGV